jgi:hypothetical protein
MGIDILPVNEFSMFDVMMQNYADQGDEEYDLNHQSEGSVNQ